MRGWTETAARSSDRTDIFETNVQGRKSSQVRAKSRVALGFEPSEQCRGIYLMS